MVGTMVGGVICTSITKLLLFLLLRLPLFRTLRHCSPPKIKFRTVLQSRSNNPKFGVSEFVEFKQERSKK